MSDILIFYPSVFALNKLFTSSSNFLINLLLLLINPTIILIDHGHFQYNCISLGLMQLAIYFLIIDSKENQLKSLLTGSIMFCLALNYKQMELYHSLPIFFYLLSLCLRSKSAVNG